MEEEDGFGQPHQDGVQSGEGEVREGGRRRRRRGRRGGRRNRQRNGERPPFQGEARLEADAQPFGEQPEYESVPISEAPVERPAPPSEASEAAPSEQEVRRRRSTIREPASLSGEGMPSTSANLPPPEPVISSTGTGETAAPKRGWWGKRLLGDKS